jgi:hypothetical protein
MYVYTAKSIVSPPTHSITVRPLFSSSFRKKRKEILQVQMMSRITLNLKKFGHQGSQDSLVCDTGPIVFYPVSARVRAEINLQNSRMGVEAYRTPEIGV